MGRPGALRCPRLPALRVAGGAVVLVLRALGSASVAAPAAALALVLALVVVGDRGEYLRWVGGSCGGGGLSGWWFLGGALAGARPFFCLGGD